MLLALEPPLGKHFVIVEWEQVLEKRNATSPALRDLSRGWRRTQTAACAFLFLMAYPLMATSLLSLPPILLRLYLFSRAFFLIFVSLILILKYLMRAPQFLMFLCLLSFYS